MSNLASSEMSRPFIAKEAPKVRRPDCRATRKLVLLVALFLPATAWPDWSFDLGGAAGWESDIGDDLEHSGAPAAHGSAWLTGGKGFSLSEAGRLHLGAGYSGRLLLERVDMSHQSLFFEVAGLFLPGDRWLLRVAPWAAGRHYGDPGRHSLLGGLAAVLRYQVRPGLALRGTGRASLRRAADTAYDSHSFGLGVGIEVDLGPKLWLRVGYGFEGAQWPGESGAGITVTPPGERPTSGPTGTFSGGTNIFAHVGAASLNLTLSAGTYLFADYVFTWLVAQGRGWPVHAVSGGVGIRR